jgi:hypothetical protein
MTAGEILATFSIFIISLFKGEGGLNRFDLLSIISPFLGLIAWALLHNPIWSLCGVVFADFMGLLPTYKKSFQDPIHESRLVYFMSATGSLITCFSVGSWNFSLLLYPVYLALGNYAVLLASYLGRIRINKV